MIHPIMIHNEYHNEYIMNQNTLEKKDVYRTIDQQILGSEDFLDEVIQKTNMGIVKHRKMKEYDLKETVGALQDAYGISLEILRGKGKSQIESKSKKLFTLIADEYGYTGREISSFIEKDPSLISRYLNEKDSLAREGEEVILILGASKDNRQA